MHLWGRKWKVCFIYTGCHSVLYVYAIVDLWNVHDRAVVFNLGTHILVGTRRHLRGHAKISYEGCKIVKKY
jgi:hypothetical protein